MKNINLPHVMHAFVTLEDSGLRVLNVATDLPLNPMSPGFSADAQHRLARDLEKFLDPRNGFDRVNIHSKN